MADKTPELVEAAVDPPVDAVVLHELPAELELRDESRREIGVRLLPWNVVAESQSGPEYVKPGAFTGVQADHVKFMVGHGSNGYDGKLVGKGVSLEQRDDGAYMTFHISKTQAGDEILELARDRVIEGVSVAYAEVPGGTEIELRDRRRVRAVNRADLRFVAMTPAPTWDAAKILFVRSKEGEPEMPPATTETPEVPATGAESPVIVQMSDDRLDKLFERLETRSGDTNQKLLDRLEKLELRDRQDIVIPGKSPDRPSGARTGEWVQTALRVMTGERVSDVQMRSLADLIVTDNIGVVPTAVVQSELVGIIDPSRPFLETTRELPVPDSGMTLQVPVIQTRPTVGVQATEKADITSTATSITNAGFDAITIAGGGDIGLQLLKRSSPSYLDLYLQLLAEAYATDADVQAIATLLDSGVTPGTGYIDPENLTIGEAWTNAVNVSRLLRPDRMWLSTRAIQEFIDAKANTTNAPLYSNLAADITVGNGAQGLISGLRPVYVPALDGSGADVLIGPSRGFVWAEDGTFTLQVDVPSKAGRDVALVGIVWFAPLYPAAFTSYRFAS